MRIYIAIALLVLIGACTSVSEERVGGAQKLYWEKGVNNPDLLEHYGNSGAYAPRHEKVVKIYGSVAPVYGQSGFLSIVKKRAAQWGCNAVLEVQRGTARQTTNFTHIHVGRYFAYASTIPVTTYVPYGTFYGIRTNGWRPPVQKGEE